MLRPKLRDGDENVCAVAKWAATSICAHNADVQRLPALCYLLVSHAASYLAFSGPPQKSSGRGAVGCTKARD